MKKLLGKSLIVLAVLTPLAANAATESERQELLSLLSEHPRWRQQEQNVYAVEADLDAAQQPIYNPELSLSYEDADTAAYQVGVSQTIDRSDKRAINTRIAETRLEKQRLIKRQENNRLIADTLRAMAELDSSNQQLVLETRNLALMQSLVEQAEKQYQAGDINQSDLKLVRLSVSNSILSQTEANNRHAKAEATITELLGQGGLQMAVHDLSFQPPSAADINAILPRVLDVRLAKLDSQLSQLDIKRAASLSKADPTIGFSLGDDDGNATAAVTFTVPLNIRNSYSAEQRASAFRNNQSTERLNQVLRASQTLLEMLQTQLQILDRGNRQSKQDSETEINAFSALMNRMLQLGEITTRDYLQNLQQRNEAIASAIELNARYQQAGIDWLEASDQLFSWLNR
ncbi:TolC family protein [Marinobacterium jannaschii]|uniref:TolC family protein n=1 Tax=Marinobacterium jannaschii TaxID=64970 RepID=UPI000485405D|nr:TolC family protein [Marinobacterium jannaschii]